MPNKPPPNVRNATAIDRRIARSTHALGNALIELIKEREFSDITVQEIIDRAGVGRTTFYAHYRNKDDVLHSSYDRMFEMFEMILEQSAAGSVRLFPVTEFLEHAGSSRDVGTALQRAGQLDEFWSLFAGYAARIIEKQIARSTVKPLHMPPQLVARMLAGALLESVRWWMDHPGAATSVAMDRAFHTLATSLLRTVE